MTLTLLNFQTIFTLSINKVHYTFCHQLHLFVYASLLFKYKLYNTVLTLTYFPLLLQIAFS